MSLRRPFPEVLPGPRGAPWTIHGTTYPVGITDLVGKTMIVPHTNTPTGSVLRAREMIRAAITPRASLHALAAKAGVTETSLHAANEARIHLTLRRLDDVGTIDLDAIAESVVTTLPLKDIQLSWETRFPADRVTVLYEATCLGLAYHPLRGLSDRIVGPLVASRPFEALVLMSALRDAFTQLRTSKHTVPSWPRVVAAARILDQLLGRGLCPSGGGPEGATDDLDDVAFEDDSEIEDRADDTENTWCPMTIETVPMTENPEIRRRMRANRHTDAGVALGNIERVLVDERCFIESRLVNAGTVLVDCSGSMHLSASDIESIVRRAPAATVALYAGDGSEGILRIVAHRAQIATHQKAFQLPNGNCVDGPALEWLGTQANPRIWVSDGIVTGRNDATAGNLYREAYELTVRHRISRIMDIEHVGHALAALNNAKRKGSYS